MIAFLRAFAWLRWRVLVNGLNSARRRDTAERLSAVLALVIPILLAVSLAGAALGVGLLGYLAGAAAADSSEPERVLLAMRFVLLAVLLFVLVIPFGGTNAAAHNRFLLLPIPRDALHRIEALASLADPWILVMLPGLAMFAAATALAGKLGVALVALAAALAWTALLASLRTLITSLTSWLLRSRRRGELLTVVGVLAVSLVGVLPALLADRVEEGWRGAKTKLVERIDAALPDWVGLVPSELYARSIDASFEGDARWAWLAILVLALEALGVYVLSSAAHRALLGSVESGRGARRRSVVVPFERRFPGLSAAASTVAIVQFRSALRTVRGRVVLFLPGPVVALLGMVWRSMPEDLPGFAMLGTHGHIALGAGIVFSLYAMQSFTMNQFASDRAGLTLLFLAPISDLELARGKTLGCALFLGVAVAICAACALFVAPGGSPLLWGSVVLGGLATYLWMAPLATFFSALFPRAADLSKTGGGGNPHTFPFLVGSVVVLALTVPPSLVIATLAHELERPGVAFLVVLAWTVAAAAVSIPLLGVAARAIAPRRENLALVARGR